jgi:hypothetical protein
MERPMSTIKDSARLGQHIAAQHGWPAAKAFKAYGMSDADRAIIAQGAVDVLRLVGAVSLGAGALSAALAVTLERRLSAPIQVVAGVLAVEGVPVFGDPLADPAARLAQGQHVWVMVGSHIVDIAIFAAAYSAQGPARLARHVDLIFGPGKALYVDSWKRTRLAGLTYVPQAVLSAGEVTALMGEAMARVRPEG